MNWLNDAIFFEHLNDEIKQEWRNDEFLEIVCVNDEIEWMTKFFQAGMTKFSVEWRNWLNDEIFLCRNDEIFD